MKHQLKKEKYNWQRSKADIEKYWTELVSKNLVGKTITKVEYVNDINIDISSSHIKLQLQNKLPINKSLIDPRVIHYIEQNKLYAS